MNFVEQNTIPTTDSDSKNSNEFFDSSETVVDTHSPSLIKHCSSIDNFNYINTQSLSKNIGADLDLITGKKSSLYEKFDNVIISDIKHKFRLQKLNTVNGISYSIKPISTSTVPNIKFLLNNLLFINQTENDILYKPKNTFKKVYFTKENKHKNFKTLENLLFITNTSNFSLNKEKLVLKILHSTDYPTAQKNIICHILSNDNTINSNTHSIPLQIFASKSNTCFLKLPMEFKIIEMMFLKDFVAYLNIVNYQKSIADYHKNKDYNIYKIKIKNKSLLRYPIWLIKEAYIFILKQVCDDTGLEKFFIIFFFKFIAGNNVCYNLPDGNVYRRHVENSNKSKRHNHNMSRFEYISSLDSQFSKIISKLSVYLLLIEYCRQQKIQIISLFCNKQEEIVLIVRNAPQIIQGIKSSIEQVFYIDDYIYGIDNIIGVYQFF